jgi:uncharacterized alpha-E superfamily protein
MISRVADYCFWFGRYVERAESTARLLQATRTLVFDADLPVTQCWQPLIIVSGEQHAFCERFGADATGDGERVQDYLTWHPNSGVSLLSSVRAARECARVIRDTLSLDTWEAINELYHFLGRDSTEQLYHENREELYKSVRKSTQLVLGLVRSTMLHDEPMSFLWLGAMIERAGQVARLLDMHHHTIVAEGVAEGMAEDVAEAIGDNEGAPAHDIVKVALWLSLLKACSGAEAFMKRHQGRVSAQAVVSFLLFESGFPRSLVYCLRSSRSLLRGIWPAPTDVPGAAAAGEPRLSTARIDALVRWLEAQKATLEGGDIHGLLTHIVDETAAICTLVSTEIQGPPRKARPAPQTQTQSQGTQPQST